MEECRAPDLSALDKAVIYLHVADVSTDADVAEFRRDTDGGIAHARRR